MKDEQKLGNVLENLDKLNKALGVMDGVIKELETKEVRTKKKSSIFSVLSSDDSNDLIHTQSKRLHGLKEAIEETAKIAEKLLQGRESTRIIQPNLFTRLINKAKSNFDSRGAVLEKCNSLVKIAKSLKTECITKIIPREQKLTEARGKIDKIISKLDSLKNKIQLVFENTEEEHAANIEEAERKITEVKNALREPDFLVETGLETLLKEACIAVKDILCVIKLPIEEETVNQKSKLPEEMKHLSHVISPFLPPDEEEQKSILKIREAITLEQIVKKCDELEPAIDQVDKSVTAIRQVMHEKTTSMIKQIQQIKDLASKTINNFEKIEEVKEELAETKPKSALAGICIAVRDIVEIMDVVMEGVFPCDGRKELLERIAPFLPQKSEEAKEIKSISVPPEIISTCERLETLIGQMSTSIIQITIAITSAGEIQKQIESLTPHLRILIDIMDKIESLIPKNHGKAPNGDEKAPSEDHGELNIANCDFQKLPQFLNNIHRILGRVQKLVPSISAVNGIKGTQIEEGLKNFAKKLVGCELPDEMSEPLPHPAEILKKIEPFCSKVSAALKDLNILEQALPHLHADHEMRELTEAVGKLADELNDKAQKSEYKAEIMACREAIASINSEGIAALPKICDTIAKTMDVVFQLLGVGRPAPVVTDDSLESKQSGDLPSVILKIQEMRKAIEDVCRNIHILPELEMREIIKNVCFLIRGIGIAREEALKQSVGKKDRLSKCKEHCDIALDCINQAIGLIKNINSSGDLDLTFKKIYEATNAIVMAAKELQDDQYTEITSLDTTAPTVSWEEILKLKRKVEDALKNPARKNKEKKAEKKESVPARMVDFEAEWKIYLRNAYLDAYSSASEQFIEEGAHEKFIEEVHKKLPTPVSLPVAIRSPEEETRKLLVSKLNTLVTTLEKVAENKKLQTLLNRLKEKRKDFDQLIQTKDLVNKNLSDINALSNNEEDLNLLNQMGTTKDCVEDVLNHIKALSNSLRNIAVPEAQGILDQVIKQINDCEDKDNDILKTESTSDWLRAESDQLGKIIDIASTSLDEIINIVEQPEKHFRVEIPNEEQQQIVGDTENKPKNTSQIEQKYQQSDTKEEMKEKMKKEKTSADLSDETRRMLISKLQKLVESWKNVPGQREFCIKVSKSFEEEKGKLNKPLSQIKDVLKSINAFLKELKPKSDWENHIDIITAVIDLETDTATADRLCEIIDMVSIFFALEVYSKILKEAEGLVETVTLAIKQKKLSHPNHMSKAETCINSASTALKRQATGTGAYLAVLATAHYCRCLDSKEAGDLQNQAIDFFQKVKPYVVTKKNEFSQLTERIESYGDFLGTHEPYQTQKSYPAYTRRYNCSISLPDDEQKLNEILVSLKAVHAQIKEVSETPSSSTHMQDEKHSKRSSRQTPDVLQQRDEKNKLSLKETSLQTLDAQLTKWAIADTTKQAKDLVMAIQFLLNSRDQNEDKLSKDQLLAKKMAKFLSGEALKALEKDKLEKDKAIGVYAAAKSVEYFVNFCEVVNLKKSDVEIVTNGILGWDKFLQKNTKSEVEKFKKVYYDFHKGFDERLSQHLSTSSISTVKKGYLDTIEISMFFPRNFLKLKQILTSLTNMWIAISDKLPDADAAEEQVEEQLKKDVEASTQAIFLLIKTIADVLPTSDEIKDSDNEFLETINYNLFCATSCLISDKEEETPVEAASRVKKAANWTAKAVSSLDQEVLKDAGLTLKSTQIIRNSNNEALDQEEVKKIITEAIISKNLLTKSTQKTRGKSNSSVAKQGDDAKSETHLETDSALNKLKTKVSEMCQELEAIMGFIPSETEPRFLKEFKAELSFARAHLQKIDATKSDATKSLDRKVEFAIRAAYHVARLASNLEDFFFYPLEPTPDRPTNVSLRISGDILYHLRKDENLAKKVSNVIQELDKIKTDSIRGVAELPKKNAGDGPKGSAANQVELLVIAEEKIEETGEVKQVELLITCDKEPEEPAEVAEVKEERKPEEIRGKDRGRNRSKSKSKSEGNLSKDKRNDEAKSKLSIASDIDPSVMDQSVQIREFEEEIRGMYQTIRRIVPKILPREQRLTLLKKVDDALSDAWKWLNKATASTTREEKAQYITYAAYYVAEAAALLSEEAIEALGSTTTARKEGWNPDNEKICDNIRKFWRNYFNPVDQNGEDPARATQRFLEDTRKQFKGIAVAPNRNAVEAALTRSSKKYQLLSAAGAVGSVGTSIGVSTSLFTVGYSTFTAVGASAAVFAPLGWTFAVGAFFSLAMLSKIRSEKDVKKRERLQASALSRSKWGGLSGAALIGIGAVVVIAASAAFTPVGAALILFGIGVIGASYGLGAASAYDTEKKREQSANNADPQNKSREQKEPDEDKRVEEPVSSSSSAPSNENRSGSSSPRSTRSHSVSGSTSAGAGAGARMQFTPPNDTATAIKLGEKAPSSRDLSPGSQDIVGDPAGQAAGMTALT